MKIGGGETARLVRNVVRPRCATHISGRPAGCIRARMQCIILRADDTELMITDAFFFFYISNCVWWWFPFNFFPFSSHSLFSIGFGKF